MNGYLNFSRTVGYSWSLLKETEVAQSQRSNQKKACKITDKEKRGKTGAIWTFLTICFDDGCCRCHTRVAAFLYFLFSPSAVFSAVHSVSLNTSGLFSLFSSLFLFLSKLFYQQNWIWKKCFLHYFLNWDEFVFPLLSPLVEILQVSRMCPHKCIYPPPKRHYHKGWFRRAKFASESRSAMQKSKSGLVITSSNKQMTLVLGNFPSQCLKVISSLAASWDSKNTTA